MPGSVGESDVEFAGAVGEERDQIKGPVPLLLGSWDCLFHLRGYSTIDDSRGAEQRQVLSRFLQGWGLKPYPHLLGIGAQHQILIFQLWDRLGCRFFLESQVPRATLGKSSRHKEQLTQNRT